MKQSGTAIAVLLLSPKTSVQTAGFDCGGALGFHAELFSAELFLFGLIDISCGAHFFEQLFGAKIMGLHEILQRFTVIPQLGVEEPQKKIGVHLKGV
jgi:hypothetical protein